VWQGKPGQTAPIEINYTVRYSIQSNLNPPVPITALFTDAVRCTPSTQTNIHKSSLKQLLAPIPPPTTSICVRFVSPSGKPGAHLDINFFCLQEMLYSRTNQQIDVIPPCIFFSACRPCCPIRFDISLNVLPIFSK
jgi:hypothetical protein